MSHLEQEPDLTIQGRINNFMERRDDFGELIDDTKKLTEVHDKLQNSIIFEVPDLECEEVSEKLRQVWKEHYRSLISPIES